MDPSTGSKASCIITCAQHLTLQHAPEVFVNPEIQFSSFLMPHAIRSDRKVTTEPRHQREGREPVCTGSGRFEGDPPLCYPQGLLTVPVHHAVLHSSVPVLAALQSMGLSCYFRTEAVRLGEWNLFLAYRGQRHFEKSRRGIQPCPHNFT